VNHARVPRRAIFAKPSRDFLQPAGSISVSVQRAACNAQRAACIQVEAARLESNRIESRRMREYFINICDLKSANLERRQRKGRESYLAREKWSTWSSNLARVSDLKIPFLSSNITGFAG